MEFFHAIVKPPTRHVLFYMSGPAITVTVEPNDPVKHFAEIESPQYVTFELPGENFVVLSMVLCQLCQNLFKLILVCIFFYFWRRGEGKSNLQKAFQKMRKIVMLNEEDCYVYL